MNRHGKIMWVLRTLLGITIASSAILTVMNVGVKGNMEWSNNATLIAEVGVGISVAIIVLIFTRRNEHVMDAKISEVLDITKEWKKIRDDRERRVYRETRLSLDIMLIKITAVINSAELFGESDDRREKKELKMKIISNSGEIGRMSKSELDDMDWAFQEFLPPFVRSWIRDASDLCKMQPGFSLDKKTADVSSFIELKNKINAIIVEVDKKGIGIRPSMEDPLVVAFARGQGEEEPADDAVRKTPDNP